MNKSDWDSSDIIFYRKICIYLAIGPSLAGVTKIFLMKICSYFIFGHWQEDGLNSKFA